MKLIGATAHYATTDLDEGPIIEQETAGVDHTMSPEELVSIGSDLESVVLSRHQVARRAPRVREWQQDGGIVVTAKIIDGKAIGVTG